MDVLTALREGLAPHYTVEREIGTGGMARVYLAAERHPPRQVAIKVMEPELSTVAFRERFIREVELTSKLNHPHIVPILAADECLFVPDGPEGLCYYIMPYVEGESLRDRLRREKRLSLDDALGITFEVAVALSYAHGQGVVHRDIKPENILLSGGHAMVTDFGIARAISLAGLPTLTRAGQPIGSPAYMSPEQWIESHVADARSDIYSLGCVLYEMLVGAPPTVQLAEQSAADRTVLEFALRQEGVSWRTARLVREALSRALATRPQDRFGSVAELTESLRNARAATVRGRWGIASRFQLRGWRSLLLGTAGLTLLVGVVAVDRARRGPVLYSHRVLVAALENQTGDPALDPLGHMAADWITQGLAQTGSVEVVPVAAAPARAGRRKGTRDADRGRIQHLAQRSRAGTAVSGAYYREQDSVRFQLQVIDTRAGVVLRALVPVVAPVDAPLEAIETLRRRVIAAFDTLFSAGRAK